MLPVIALAGRPNVGKSTLFNRLTRTRDALVASYPGLTRDRQYGLGAVGDLGYVVVDTGGLAGDGEGIDQPVAAQAIKAMEEADLVLFLVDAKDGRSPGDSTIATLLREKQIPTLLVANKIDGQNPDFAAGEFFALGLGEPHCISASQGKGVRQLIEEAVVPMLAPVEEVPLQEASAQEEPPQEEPPQEEPPQGASPQGEPLQEEPPQEEPPEGEEQPEGEEEPTPQGIRIAVVGRPNVGKSTLVNRMLGEERVLVFDEAGTTRDSIYIPFERGDQTYTLIDTAGVRRRGRVQQKVEKLSVIKTLEAIDKAQVVILLIDATEGLVEQDLHLLSHILDAGRALVLAVNKWDGTSPDQKAKVRETLSRRLTFIDLAAIHFISALHGSNVGLLYKAIHQAYAAATVKVPTSRLNEILERAVQAHQPPLVRGRRIKLRYAHLGGSNPPVIVIHGNQTQDVPDPYRRYLEHKFMEALEIKGTPLRLEFRTGQNPYQGRKNKLTQRQENRRKRMIRHVKKAAKKARRKTSP